MLLMMIELYNIYPVLACVIWKRLINIDHTVYFTYCIRDRGFDRSFCICVLWTGIGIWLIWFINYDEWDIHDDGQRQSENKLVETNTF